MNGTFQRMTIIIGITTEKVERHIRGFEQYTENHTTFNEYDGSLYRNIAFKVDGENYYSDSEGIVIKLENNGWMKILFYK